MGVGVKGWGQTNPLAHNLSTGNWSLTGWNTAVATGSYPTNGATGANATTGVIAGAINANMVFWLHSGDPAIAAAQTANFNNTYTAGSGKIVGNSTSGFYFDNTGGVGIGSAVLAINTINRINIQVNWTGRTISVGARQYGIRLQYRIGNTGTFLDANGTAANILYTGGTAGTSSILPTITLPVTAENQNLVQLLWRFYYIGPSTGIRPQFGIDEINVSSSPNAAINKYWDATAGAANGTGGSATWGSTFSSTAAGDAALTTAASSDDAIFEGTAGVVTLATSQTVKSSTINTTNYDFRTSATSTFTSTDGIALGTNSVIFSPITGADLTIPNVISNANLAANTTLTKNGAGVLTLEGLNTFTGKILVTNGLIAGIDEGRFGASPGVFTADQLRLNGGGFQNIAGANLLFNSSRGIYIGVNDGIFDVTNGQTITLNTAVTGIGTLVKNNTGTLIFTGSSNYSGSTRINAGVIQINAANLIPAASYLYLNGGTFNTGSTVGFNQNLGQLHLLATSTIALGTGNHSLNFSNSSAASWSGSVLNINGWIGTVGASGTGGKIFVGTDASGLTAAQLAKISFTGFGAGAAILNTGEIVPIPSPIIALSTTTLTGFNYVQNNGPSGEQTYNLSAQFLSPAAGNVIVTASTNYEISLTSGAGFVSTTLTVPYASSTLAATPIYVRLKAGLSTANYNAETISNAGGAAVTQNVTVSGNVTSSAVSDIATDATFGYTSNINYTTWQAATITNAASSVGVHNIIVRDGGAVAPDVDALPTILNAITFNYSGAANTIKSASLFSTTNALLSSSITAGANSITFNGLNAANFTVADNGTLQLILRVTFNNAVTDNDKLIFTVASATTASAATSSQFATANAGAAVSDNNNANDRNRIEVTADRLAFVQQPTNNGVNTNMAPSPIVSANDVNGNKDLDFVGQINITSTGILNFTPQLATANAGLATFNAINHTGAGTGFALTASYAGFTSVVSGLFDITAITFTTNDFRTISGGTWSTQNAGTASWENWNGSTWVASSRPTSATLHTAYIRHALTQNGSTAIKSIVIENAGTYSIVNASTVNNSLLIKSGGLLEINATLTNNGTFEIEDNGTVSVGYLATNASPMWNGIENFKPNSNFIIKEWGANNATTANRALYNGTNVSSNTYNGYTAAFGNIIVDLSGSSELNTFALINSSVTTNLAHKNVNLLNPVATENISVSISGNSTSGIGGDFIVDDLFAPTRKVIFANAGVFNFTIKGNLKLDGSSTNISTISNVGQTSTVNIEGDLIITAGAVLDFSVSVSANPINTFNLKGDLSVVGSGLLQNSNTSSLGQFNFTGTGNGLTPATTQTIDIASTSANENRYIAFAVKSGAYVQQINRNFELGLNSGVVVEGGGVFDFGFAGTTALLTNISGSQTGSYFNSQQGSTLKITSTDGITKTALLGNVQVPLSNRTYDQLATFHYIGKAPQVTGNGITSGGTGKVIICDLIDNNTQLSLTNNTSITSGLGASTTGGKLDIRKGQVIETTTEYITGSTGSLYMSVGTLYKIAKGNSNAVASMGDLIPRMDGIAFGYNLQGGTVELAGTGANAFQSARGFTTFKNLKYSGSNTFGTDYKNLSNTITIDTAVIITGTAVVDCISSPTNPKSFLGDGSLVMTGGRLRLLNSSFAQPELTGINNPYALTGGVVEFYANAGGESINGLYGSPTNPIEYNAIEVTGTSVQNSNSNITLGNGGTFTIKPTGIFEINTNAIVGVAAGTQTVTIETGGIFKTGDVDGFAGGTGSTTTSVRSDIENVILQSGSTVEYSKATGAAQIITNTGITSPTTANYYNLTLSGTGDKTAPSSDLTILGDLYRAGTHTYNANNGRIIFAGATAQKYYAALNTKPIDFYNFTNNNTSASGLSVDSTFGVLNELKLNTTNKINLNIGDIIMRSSATRTSYIADLGVTGVGNTANNITYNNGLFSIERYLRAYKAWRFLATPLVLNTTKIKDAWQEAGAATVGYGTQITGPAVVGAGGMDQTSVRSSMKYFDTNAGDFVEVINTNTTNINNKEGYFVFVRGDRTVANLGITGTTNMRIKGKIISGDQTYTVAANKFLSIGNPFASQIDFKQVTQTLPAGLEGSYTVWNANPVGTIYNAGKYEQRIRNITTGEYTYGGIPQNYIESGQGFFIQGSNGGGGTIVLKEEHKATGSNLASRGGAQSRAGVTIPTLEINLFTKDADGSFIKSDMAFQNFGESFSSLIDNNDVRKVMNVSDNIAITKSNLKLIAERRKPLEATDTISLNLSNTRVAAYQFLIDPSVLGNTGLEAFLQDRFLQTSTAVSLVDSTWVNFSITNDAASKATDRFIIIFKQTANTDFTTITAKRNIDKTITVNWGVANEKNITNYIVEQSNDGIIFSDLTTQNATANNGTSQVYTKLDANASKENNWYRIKLNNANGTVKYSSTAMVAAVKEIFSEAKPTIAIEPNIIVDNTIKLHLQNVTKGMYVIKMYNALGQMVQTFNVQLKNNNQIISLPINTLAKGKYYALVNDEKGTTTSLDFIVN
jgi:autotransporter-associated beta strand protein